MVMRCAGIAVLRSLVLAAPAGAHVYSTEFPGTVGRATRNRLVLHTRGRLRAGRYTVTLRSRRGPAVRTRVTIR